MTKAYHEFDNELRIKYLELNLKHLRDIEFDGVSYRQFFVDVVRKKKPFQNLSFLDYKMAYEMDFITADMKYLTGMLFFLRPGINNPLPFNGYNQTIEDRRYLMHTTFGLQAAYNFWDRLGDLLWFFFPSTLAERDVYFDRIISLIDKPYNKSNNYISLLELYNKEVKPVLQVRREAVHYFQPECKHFWGHTEDSSQEAVEKRYKEKFGYADLMLNQLNTAAKAFELTVRLIDELPDK